MEREHFPVQLRLRIDWSELDYFGHVNNVSFFKYIQSARVNFWDQIGLTHFHRTQNKGPMLASCNCTFKKPLFYPGKVVVNSRLEFIKNTSFGFSHRLFDEKDELVATASDIMVMYDFNSNNKIPIPDWMREEFDHKK